MMSEALTIIERQLVAKLSGTDGSLSDKIYNRIIAATQRQKCPFYPIRDLWVECFGQLLYPIKRLS